MKWVLFTYFNSFQLFLMPNISYPVPFLENYESNYVNQFYDSYYMVFPR